MKKREAAIPLKKSERLLKKVSLKKLLRAIERRACFR